MIFQSRIQAGKLLGQRLKRELRPGNRNNIVVLGIPRGGVVVAREVSEVLGCPLDVIAAKKISAPHQAELAIGAIGETEGSEYLNQRLAIDVGADEKYLKEQSSILKAEIKKRERFFRQGKAPLSLRSKIVIVIDDGAATGATMIAACREVWNNNPKRVVAALPVLAKDTLANLEKEADEVIYLEAPEMFFSVGQFYREFGQVEDAEVKQLLAF